MSTTLTSSGSPSAKAPGAERRRSRREPYIIDAWLAPVGRPESRTEVVTLNISRHGVGLKLAEPLAMESAYELELMPNGKRMTMKIVICRCQPMEGGFWNVGAEFC
jgi:hypothetical protein